MISVKVCAASPDRSVASFNRDFFWAAAGLMNATDSRETANKPVIKRRRDVLIKTSEQVDVDEPNLPNHCKPIRARWSEVRHPCPSAGSRSDGCSPSLDAIYTHLRIL